MNLLESEPTTVFLFIFYFDFMCGPHTMHTLTQIYNCVYAMVTIYSYHYTPISISVLAMNIDSTKVMHRALYRNIQKCLIDSYAAKSMYSEQVHSWLFANLTMEI